MKRILIGLGVLVALIGAAAAALYFFFPTEALRAQIERQVEAETERDLSLESVRLTFWPALGLAANNLTLSNPRGFTGEPFLRAERAVFQVALMPLLSGQVRVDRIRLDAPALALSVNAAGAPNWAFPTRPDQQPIDALRVDELRIENGRLSFQGAQGEPLVFEDIDARAALTSLDQPARIEGALTHRAQRLEAEATFARPRALLQQGETPLTAHVEGAPLSADLNGAFNAATGALSGELTARGQSLRDVMAWLGAPLGEGAGFAAYEAHGTLAARGAHEGTPTTVALTRARFALDAIRATGDVTLTFSEAGRARAAGALSIPTLNINPYLTPPAAGAQQGVNAQAAWPTTPIDLAGLRAADADLNLTIQTLTFQRMSFTNARMALAIANGVADANLTQISLYGGAGRARLTAHAEGNRIVTVLDADNIQAEPLLRDAIGFDRIVGRGRLQASLSGQGGTQAALMRSLSGAASFRFNDGQWKGVNLAQVARTIQSAMTGAARGAGGATDFAELSATFRVANGAAVTQDLRLLNPYARLEGQGLIDIGAQTIDMRVTPRAVNTIQGQGGAADIGGIGVPFRAHGPWSRVQFGLALGDAVQNQLRERMRAALAGQSGTPSPAAPSTPSTPSAPQAPRLPDLGGLIPRGN